MSITPYEPTANLSRMEKIKSYIGNVQYCAQFDFSGAACREVAIPLLGAAAVFAFILLFILYRLIRAQLMARRMRTLETIRRWERENLIAEPEVMASARWKGDATTATTRDERELAQEIRDALKQRKIDGG